MSDTPREKFAEATERLKTDSALRKHADAVISAYCEYKMENRYDALSILSRYGEEVSHSLVRVIGLVRGENQRESEILSDAISSGIPYSLKELGINGKDLIEIGAKGTRVGEILAGLLDLVMRGAIKNEREELISEAQKMCRN